MWLEEDELSPSDMKLLRVFLLGFVFVLISVGSLFEFIKEKIEDSADDTLAPIIDSLFGELTLMGFIGVLVFVASTTGSIEHLSEYAFPHSHEGGERLGELLETVHMVLFGVMLLFLLAVLYLVGTGRRQMRRWERFEASSYNADAVIRNRAEQIRRTAAGTLSELPRDHPAADPSLPDRVAYLALRTRFIQGMQGGAAAAPHTPSVEKSGRVDDQFDFSDYLALRQGYLVAEMVDVSPGTWLSVGVFFLAFWVLEFFVPAPLVLLGSLVGAGYALAALMRAVAHKAEAIVAALTSPSYELVAAELAAAGSSGWPPGYGSVSSESSRGGDDAAATKGDDRPLLAHEHVSAAAGDAGADRPAAAAAAGAGEGRTAPLTREAVRRNTERFLRPELSRRNSDGADAGLHRVNPNAAGALRISVDDPPYRAARLLPVARGARPVNKHEALFWFPRHGVHFMTFLIRFFLIMSVLYAVALACVAYLQRPFVAAHPVLAAALLVAGLPPLALMARAAPAMLADLTVASSVELLRDTPTMMKVARRVRTRMTVRALHLITLMHQSARMMREHSERSARSDGADAEAADAVSVRGSARRVFTDPDEYAARERELRELFDAVDADGSGAISLGELEDLMRAMGISAEDDPDYAARVVRELDEDGNGLVTFDELFDWIAMSERNARVSPAELVDEIFAVLDRDGSGEVGFSELQSAVQVLGSGSVTDAEITAIIREADTDGDGSIDKEEFKQVITRHLRG